MSVPEDDEWLEELLRTPEPPIADAGFARRTVDALPPPRRLARTRRRVLLACVALACVLALLPAAPALGESFAALVSWRAWAGPSIPWLALACIATLIALTVSLAADDT